MNIKLRSAFATLAVAALISSGMVTSASATHVAAPATNGSVVHVMKNHNCGWGITTKYHSCDLAYSLILKWGRGANYPKSMEDVFSPNSGRRYDVTCTGVKTVTCKSNKGQVKFQPAKIPQQDRCIVAFLPEEYSDVWAKAWLNVSCALTVAVAQAYAATNTLSPPSLTVKDPTDGKLLKFVCFDIEEMSWPTLCLAGKKAVVITD